MHTCVLGQHSHMQAPCCLLPSLYTAIQCTKCSLNICYTTVILVFCTVYVCALLMCKYNNTYNCTGGPHSFNACYYGKTVEIASCGSQHSCRCWSQPQHTKQGNVWHYYQPCTCIALCLSVKISGFGWNRFFLRKWLISLLHPYIQSYAGDRQLM